jgi:hypothetical protein
MTLKHNLSMIYTQSDPFWGVIIEINNASSGLLGWAFLLLVFAISTYVATRSTQDLGKSLLISLWITTLSSIILFYAERQTIGVAITHPLVSNIVMLTLLVVSAISVAGMYFLRNKGA